MLTVEKLVPDDFDIPKVPKNNEFLLRALSASDVELDYEAVMSSKIHLRQVFAESDDWPAEGMTIADNLADLQRHEREFMNRVAFAYTVMNCSEDRCLGCIYIKPTIKRSFDAAVYMWIRSDEIPNGLDEELYQFVVSWINEKWPFKNVAYPGREIDWNEWDMLP